MGDKGLARPSETGSREPGLASRPGPSGFDPAREWAGFSPLERKYLLATPAMIPADAGIIAHRAGDSSSGNRFAGFARRQAWLFQRLANCYGSAFTYRLSQDGAALLAAIAMETEGGDAKQAPWRSDESAAIAQPAAPDTSDHTLKGDL